MLKNFPASLDANETGKFQKPSRNINCNLTQERRTFSCYCSREVSIRYFPWNDAAYVPRIVGIENSILAEVRSSLTLLMRNVAKVKLG